MRFAPKSRRPGPVWRPILAALGVVCGIALLANPARSSHESIVIDGDPSDVIAAVDRNRGTDRGGLHLLDPVGEVYSGQCNYVNGFDLRNIFVFFDFKDASDRASSRTDLYIVIEASGAIGDVDGDGFPNLYGGLGSSPCALGDGFGIGSNEEYSLLFDFDGAGAFDRVVTLQGNRLFEQQTMAEIPGAEYAFRGNFLEILIPEIENFYRWNGLGLNPQEMFAAQGHPCWMNLRVRASADLDNLAEDFTVLPLQLSACWDRVLSTRATFPEIIVGDSTQASWSLLNLLNGSTGKGEQATVTDIAIDDPAFHLSDELQSELANGLTLESFLEFRTPVTFAPRHPGDYKASVRVIGESGEDIVQTFFVATARPLSLDWLHTGLYADGITGAGQDIFIPVALGDHVEADSVILSYGFAGADTVEERPMTMTIDDPVNDRYVGVIPTASGGCGVEFFITIYNGDVSRRLPSAPGTQKLRMTNRGLAFPSVQPAERYALVSVPLVIRNNSVLGVFGDDLGGIDASAWRMFGFEEGSGLYVEAPVDSLTFLNLGEAYWLITRDSALLDTGPATGITAPLDSAFTRRLQPGANLVGNPFCFPVTWAAVLAATSQPDSIAGPLGWDAQASDYVEADVLQPFAGYWVFNRAVTQVALEIPPQPATAGPATTRAERTQETVAWSLGLRAASGATTGPGVTIGMSAQSADGRDGLDRDAPPNPPGRFVALQVVHSEWPSGNGAYRSDLRHLETGSAPAASTWALDLTMDVSESRDSRPVRIEFSGASTLPPGVDPVLVDRRAQRRIRVREASGYTFMASPTKAATREADCRFVLEVGGTPIAHEASRFALRQNLPNPFRGATVIEYELPQPRRVSLAVFDLAGRHRATLDQGLRAAGLHTVTWDGRTTSGRRASPGIYFYRLDAGRQAVTRKMLILD